ncbi:MAG: nickel pincer cofactor biosynthesis protein LarB [Desulfovibrio sp.]|nr:MAG: nickel pincer cofactor biosynthesis protein LarB [Desulfovibrio sp.]
MNAKELDELLRQVAQGEVAPDKAAQAIRLAPVSRVAGSVHLDLNREMRTGMGEVVFGQGKSLSQLETAVSGLAETGRPVLATRLTSEHGQGLLALFPQGDWWPEAGLFSLGRNLSPELDDRLAWPDTSELAVATAGASDLPVALEAMGTAHFLGISPALIMDAGVAGLHRLEPHMATLGQATLHIVVAGMEGALCSVISGMFGKPVIAVPTSVGYGASFGGLAALLAMLNSCAPGVAVVNIDSGFGAAAMAYKLLTQ